MACKKHNSPCLGPHLGTILSLPNIICSETPNTPNGFDPLWPMMPMFDPGSNEPSWAFARTNTRILGRPYQFVAQGARLGEFLQKYQVVLGETPGLVQDLLLSTIKTSARGACPLRPP